MFLKLQSKFDTHPHRVLGEARYQRRSSALKLLRSWRLLFLSKSNTLHTSEVISLSQLTAEAFCGSVIWRKGLKPRVIQQGSFQCETSLPHCHKCALDTLTVQYLRPLLCILYVKIDHSDLSNP